MFTTRIPTRDLLHAIRALDWLAQNCQPLTLVRTGPRAIVYASPDAPNVAELTIRAHPFMDAEIVASVDPDAAVLVPALRGAVLTAQAPAS